MAGPPKLFTKKPFGNLVKLEIIGRNPNSDGFVPIRMARWETCRP
jgi:hypothetical protein